METTLRKSDDILVRQSKRSDSGMAEIKELPWYVAHPEDGSPVLSGTTNYLEFRTKDEAFKYLIERGFVPVADGC